MASTDDRLQKVYLEITTECNLDCRMCLRHAWHEPGRSMTWETFQNLLNGLRAVPTASVVINGSRKQLTWSARRFTAGLVSRSRRVFTICCTE